MILNDTNMQGIFISGGFIGISYVGGVLKPWYYEYRPIEQYILRTMPLVKGSSNI